ncbi:MAG TPA: peptide chain release factor N(5)-glutamine methyltransferase [Microscillaceae bacterium]|nr:peptide chain release factor N(5)-glutamine methyltransferase [Microscillaceae bacterium]
MTTIATKQLFDEYRQQLQTIYAPEEAQTIVFWLLEHFLALNRTNVLINQTIEISQTQQQALNNALERLKKHEPIQYIVGYTEFYGLTFHVRPGVLIPRPETEELVEWVVQDYRDQVVNILDIGTGSGCIAISLAKNLAQSKVQALDVSSEALQVAQSNAVENKAKVQFIQEDILNPQTLLQLIPDHSLDVVVSNPPYVTPAEKSQMQANVLDFEPDLALFIPQEQPLLFYKAIAQLATQKLKTYGRLYFEINEQFGNETKQMLEDLGFQDIIIRKDGFGKDRMVKASYLD